MNGAKRRVAYLPISLPIIVGLLSEIGRLLLLLRLGFAARGRAVLDEAVVGVVGGGFGLAFGHRDGGGDAWWMLGGSC